MDKNQIAGYGGTTFTIGEQPAYGFLGGADLQAPPVVFETSYGDNFLPQNLSPGATSILDVLKYGFGRVVDQNIASIQAQNSQPQYAAPLKPGQGIVRPNGTINLADLSPSKSTLMLMLAAAGLWVLFAAKGEK